MKAGTLAPKYKALRTIQHYGSYVEAGHVFNGGIMEAAEAADLVARGIIEVFFDDRPEPDFVAEYKNGEIWPPVPLLWPGETVVCIATGPSLTSSQVAAVRGRARVIAVNDAYRLAPWADALYACDPEWWELYAEDHEWAGARHSGAIKFGGMKITQNADAAARWGLHLVPSRVGKGISTNSQYIHTGGNSGFQAVNLARHLGAARVILVGYDMRADPEGKTHYFGAHPGRLRKHSPYADFVAHFRAADPQLKGERVEVLNATHLSALNCFPYFPIDEALARPMRYRFMDAPKSIPPVAEQDWAADCERQPPATIARAIPEDARFPARRKPPAAPQDEAATNWPGSVTFATVLRPSAAFGPRDVDRLARAIRRNITRPHRIVCLTELERSDFNEEVEAVPLEHPEWETKHTKLELFRPDLLDEWDRTIYFDLDTVIMGSLEDIAGYRGAFAMLQDFYYSMMSGSGMMAWDADDRLAEIYEDFCRTPLSVRREIYPIGGGRGDQLFIRHHTPVAPHRLQDCFPGQIGSYKAHFRNRPAPKIKPRVICFHGKPKPEGVSEKWITRHWK